MQDEDIFDYRPSTTVLSSYDILFNDLNIRWDYIGFPVLDFQREAQTVALAMRTQEGTDNFNTNYQPKIDRITHNRSLNLESEQLAYIFTYDQEGVIDYLYGKREMLINQVYKILTGKEPKYYEHTLTGWIETTRTDADSTVLSAVKSDADILLVRGDGMPDDLIDIILPAITIGLIYVGLSEIALFAEGVTAFGFYNALTAYSYGVLRDQLTSWRALTQLQNRECISDYGIEHIFFGTTYKEKASGYHYEGISSNVTIEAGTLSEVDSFGVYQAKVLVDGIVKNTNGDIQHFFQRAGLHNRWLIQLKKLF